MSSRSDAKFSDEYFEQCFEIYRELCSKTPRVWLTFFLGTVGQGFALSSLFEVLTGRPLRWLATPITLFPFLINMALVFLKVPPPVTPRAYRRMLSVVVWWFVANAAVSVIAALIRSRTAPDVVNVAVVCACVLVGLTGIGTIVKYRNKFRNLERAFGHIPDRGRGA